MAAMDAPALDVQLAEQPTSLALDEECPPQSFFQQPELPPLPTPKRDVLFLESLAGGAIAFSALAVVCATDVFALEQPNVPSILRLSFPALILPGAAASVVCYLRIMCCDAGVIRSPGTCADMPQKVLEVLRSSKPSLEGMANIVEGDRSFCVRCLVWRDSAAKPHHCSLCQRCVADFDHHCGILGICIAGQTPWQRRGDTRCCTGNIVFFWILLALGFAGMVTSMVAVVIAVVYSSGVAAKIIAGCILGAIVACCCCIRNFIRRYI